MNKNPNIVRPKKYPKIIFSNLVYWLSFLNKKKDKGMPQRPKTNK
jgi:hypothetical protein